MIMLMVMFIAAADQTQAVVNGNMDIDVVSLSKLLSGSNPNVGDDGSPIDDGWVSHESEGAASWGVVDGWMERSNLDPYYARGVGQIISATKVGVGHGGVITFRFDYDVVADSDSGLSYALYGIGGTGVWDMSDGYTLHRDSHVPVTFIDGDRWGWTVLDSGTYLGEDRKSGFYTHDISIEADYQYFAVIFHGDTDSMRNSSNWVKFDNVSLHAVSDAEQVVPETKEEDPSAPVVGLIGLGMLALFLIRRL